MNAKSKIVGTLLGLALPLSVGATAWAGFAGVPVRRCAPDAVRAGTLCVDRFEESVWRVPQANTVNARLVNEIRLGRATRADLVAAGAAQLGVDGDDYAPCRDDGQNCADDIFAVSLAAERPAQSITWFQAQEACANSGKRLPSSAEWQVAANGSPDLATDDGTTDCNIESSFATAPTGSRTSCVSARGARDTTGNIDEWVANWLPRSNRCPSWGGFSDDLMCLAGASRVDDGPGAVTRGGGYTGGTDHAGPLSVFGAAEPSSTDLQIGFRCAR